MSAKTTRILVAAGVATTAVFCMGGFGLLSSAWGYGLLLVSALLLMAGLGALCIFVFATHGTTPAMARAAAWLSGLGGLAYLLGAAALLGFFFLETVQGRMEWRWVLFAPAVIAAMGVLEWGLWVKLVRPNLVSRRRFARFLQASDAEPERMRRRFVDEVVVQRTLFSISPFRWLKHGLILWGFVLMVVTEGIAVCFREAFPALGWGGGAWIEGHGLRQGVDFAFDLSGTMMLLGCALALGWRVHVAGRDELKYTDTPTVLMLGLVILSGFLVEAMRFAAMEAAPWMAYSFVGNALAATLFAGWAPGAAAHEAAWIVHMGLACAFIAYVPLRRLIHSCATPAGRLMHSQTALLEAKKHGVLAGLLGGAAAPELKEPTP